MLSAARDGGSYNLSAAEKFAEGLKDTIRKSDGFLAKVLQSVRKHLIAAVNLTGNGWNFVDW